MMKLAFYLFSVIGIAGMFVMLSCLFLIGYDGVTNNYLFFLLVGVVTSIVFMTASCKMEKNIRGDKKC